MQPITAKCPNCGVKGLRKFYECRAVPAHSVLLLKSRQEALDFPKGNIELAFCSVCQFITNVAFDPALERYGAGYEATQSFSSTFNSFHQKLAEDLISRYDLHGKDIIEVGCGQGEFLELLCRLGENRGIGFDPAYSETRSTVESNARIRIIDDFYSEKYSDHRGDFVCCKQTLEHIPDTFNFIELTRRVVGNNQDTIVFFQVPDVTRVLCEVAFWDIYYEHCSYFSVGSLRHVFDQNRFDVIGSRVEYGDQYLMLEAKPGDGSERGQPAIARNGIAAAVQQFELDHVARLEQWRTCLRELAQEGRRTVLWGGGSKAVAFLTTLGIEAEVEYVIDINPHKHGTFLPGSGHEVVGPERLKEYQPDVVIVMNPIYSDEIRDMLGGMGVSAEMMPITAFS